MNSINFLTYKRVVLIVFSFIIFTSACTQQDKVRESELSLLKTTNPEPAVVEKEKFYHMGAVENIKNEVNASPEIYDVAVVKNGKEVLVAYKVKHLQRFRMKEIEKLVNERLKKKFPDEEFVVSSDYKIFLETVKLKERLEKKNYNEKKIRKQFNDIVKLTKELT